MPEKRPERGAGDDSRGSMVLDTAPRHGRANTASGMDLGIKPLQGKILVEKMPMESRTPSGLFLPREESRRYNGQLAKVLAVHPDDILPFGIGDLVVVGRYAGQDIRPFLGSETLALMESDDVIAVVED